ncbi:Ice-binding [Hyphodiscus hymeniophilus]|uniref:Ice-binding n=1 Tax=Hyphodiscus hymeniophilus TaxID=353542 RepID=A0A9P7AVR0_9HELO|nr:Ice-binding [Hyphodiscus hymeniophilus]
MERLILLYLLCHVALISAQTVSLGSAASFAILGGTTITNTGPSVITGDIGLSPGSSITGLPPGGPGVQIGGSQYVDDNVAISAKNDALTAYNTIAALGGATDLTGQDLGGLTLAAGVYSFDNSAQLTGPLILSSSTPNATWYFQIGSTLTTATASVVILQGTAQACNVFWQVGSSATIGTQTTFQGLILAQTSITMVTSATSNGGLFALTGAVTLDTNNVNVAVCPVQSSSIAFSSTAGGGGGVPGGTTTTTTAFSSTVAAASSAPGAGGVGAGTTTVSAFSSTIPAASSTPGGGGGNGNGPNGPNSGSNTGTVSSTIGASGGGGGAGGGAVTTTPIVPEQHLIGNPNKLDGESKFEQFSSTFYIKELVCWTVVTAQYGDSGKLSKFKHILDIVLHSKFSIFIGISSIRECCLNEAYIFKQFTISIVFGVSSILEWWFNETYIFKQYTIDVCIFDPVLHIANIEHPIVNLFSGSADLPK